MQANLSFATSSHNHSAAEITSGTLSVLRGGTGVTTSSGSGPNALGTVSDAQSTSTIMKRNSSGYAHAVYFNATGSFALVGADSGMDNFIGTNGTDTYARSYTQVGAIARLQTGAWNFTTGPDVGALSIPYYITAGYTSGRISVSSSAPGSPAKGDIWFDTS